MATKEATQKSLELEGWVQNLFNAEAFRLERLAGDASFRSYYRLFLGDKTFVVMSAGQDKASSAAFVALARAFQSANLMAPHILEQDEARGYMLLSDLGDELYLNHLTDKTADDLYQRAFSALFTLQTCTDIPNYSLPLYDRELFLREMNLFRDWYLTKHFGFSLSAMENELLDYIFDLLIVDASAQPKVCVHRDFHSRNLMVLEPKNVGLLDFQDAVLGPVTYDLLSLLRDCYISWPEERVRAWVRSFFDQKNAGQSVMISDWEQFYHWFDWMSLQRHLKCIGIFARLNARDHKPQYLNDIPRVLNYVERVSRPYPEFKEFTLFLTKRKIFV
jgi:aminoglycoside/choline kinase family phosphotransferase